MTGLNHSNHNLSKLSRILLGIVLEWGWQNLPQSNFFPLQSPWERLQLGTQNQKRLLHTCSLCAVWTVSAWHRELSLSLARRQKGPEGSSGSSTFYPSQPEPGLLGLLLENLLEVFLPWHKSSYYDTHHNSSAEKQPPPWPRSAEHLHFYQQSWWQICVLCLFSALLPTSCLCCLSLSLFKVAPDLQQCNLDQNQALRRAPDIHFHRSLHFVTRNLLDLSYLKS